MKMFHKHGYTLRPRVRRRTPMYDIAMATILGVVSGVYIFQDTLKYLPKSNVDTIPIQETDSSNNSNNGTRGLNSKA